MTPQPTSTSGHQAAWSPNRILVSSFAAFVLITVSWALFNPLMASPDEPSHLTKAVATVHGQVINSEILTERVVRVPEIYVDVRGLTCNAFDPEVPASDCDTATILSTDSPDGWVTDYTPAGLYNPVYYLLISWPALFSHSLASIYAMRLLSAVVASFFLALGMRSLAQANLPHLAVAISFAGITPVALFLAASINPQALEISASFALWAQLYLILRDPDNDKLISRMWWLAFTAVFLANSRGLSPFFMTLIVVAVVAVHPWSHTVQVLRNRRSWTPIGVATLGTGVASAWILGTGMLSTSTTSPEPGITPGWLASYTLQMTGTYIRQAVGAFGWTHVQLPKWMVLLFLGGALLGGLWALRQADLRRRIVLALCTPLFTIGIPVALHASQAYSLGIMWQGRYILPLAIGIPIMAAMVIADNPGVTERTQRHLARLWTAIFLAIHLWSVVLEISQHMGGLKHILSPAEGTWQPPLPVSTLILCLTGSAVVFWLTAEQIASPGRIRDE